MSYGPLIADSLYLRRIFIGTDDGDLITPQGKIDAETFADSIIESELGMSFSEVSSKYPPLIIVIAQLLGSAQIYRSVYSLHLAQGGEGGEKSQADILEDRAMEYIKRIKDGSLILYDADGDTIDGFGLSGYSHSIQSIEEQDEDIIFDIRADQEDLKKPAKAYGEPEYTDS